MIGLDSFTECETVKPKRRETGHGQNIPDVLSDFIDSKWQCAYIKTPSAKDANNLRCAFRYWCDQYGVGIQAIVRHDRLYLKREERQ